jgi:hypothetical protein
MGKRARLFAVVALIAVAGLAAAIFRLSRLPPADTVEGAYVRLARAIAEDRAGDCFDHLDDVAQRAAARIAADADEVAARIEASYPEAEREAALAPYRDLARADGGAGVWALLAARRGWIARLRLDLSGVGAVQIDGDRATLVTARGTRYPFQRRPGGGWGLGLFTAELAAESARLGRVRERIAAAADDYERDRAAR